MSLRPRNRSAPILHLPVEDGTDPADATPAPPVPIGPQTRAPLADLLPPVEFDAARLYPNRVVALDRAQPASAAFDVLRTRLLRLARQNGWTTIAVTAPTAGSGTTVLTANLALSLSCQTDCRTVLLDLNLRNPGLAALLGTEDSARLGDFLRGDLPLADALVRYGDTLAVGTVAEPVETAAELLQARTTATRLGEIEPMLLPDIILVDAPPVRQRDDFQATLGLFDAVLLVADANNTLMADIDRCEREISEQTNLAGVIVNRCDLAR